MATATIYPTVDGFLNNISGWYPSEGFDMCRSTSSSDGDYCELYLKFTTVGAGIGASDTINSVTVWIDVYSYSDINAVGGWLGYTDINNIWSTSSSFTEAAAPYINPSMAYGTVSDGSWSVNTTGWFSKSITTSIPHSDIFGHGIKAQLGDLGPAEFRIYDKDHANKPYIVIDYTPAATTSPKQWSFAPHVLRFGNEDDNQLIRL